MESQLTREQKKIFRNLNGIRGMTKLPGALVAVDVGREVNALNEARNLGIPTICLIDTDGNPELADIPIPGNDDSMRAIDIVIRELCAAVTEGKSIRAEAAVYGDAAPETAPAARRRSSRSQFRARGRADEAGEVASPRVEAAAPIVEGA
jgi:small subunit ribosomal protein S2